MAEAIKARDVVDKAAQRQIRKVERQRRMSVRDARRVFDGKTFAGLTSEEKDELLRILAVKAGLIEE